MGDPVETLLKGHTPVVQDISLRLRELVRTTIPGVTERVHQGWKTISYGTGEGRDNQVCAISPYKKWVNLSFPKGTDLDDPGNLLGGDGANMRHVKIHSPDNFDREGLIHLLRAAVEVVATH